MCRLLSRLGLLLILVGEARHFLLTQDQVLVDVVLVDLVDVAATFVGFFLKHGLDLFLLEPK